MKPTVAPYETAAWCVRIECVGGLVLRLTTYPYDLTMSNATVYETDSGYEQTAYSSGTGMAASAIDLEGFTGISGIERSDIASGLFDNARVYIFKCNFLNPVEDFEEITSGFFGKTTIIDERYRIEGMSLIDALSQSVGRDVTPGCAWTYGSPQCGIDLTPLNVTGTLTAVNSGSSFTDSARAEADDYFIAGTIKFTSGANAGNKPLEVKSFSAGAITTHEPFYYAPAIGDAYTITPGCRRRFSDCQEKSNVLNFGGFPHMPLQSTYVAVGGA